MKEKLKLASITVKESFSLKLLMGTSIIIILSSFLLNYVVDYPSSDVLLKQEYFVAVLVSINFLIVFINTIIFVYEMINSSKESDLNHYDEKDKILDRRTTLIFMIFNFITLVISVFILVLYGIKVFFGFFSWGSLFKASEYLSLLMFGCFIFADYSIYKSLLLAKNSNVNKLDTTKAEDIIPKIQKTLDDINKKLKFTFYAIWLIDISGFIGILLILIVSHLLEIQQKHIFVEGFAVGAIAFHILFTQMNFTILNIFSMKGNLT